MMVWFAVEDGHGSVNLFHEQHAYHLVGERHAAEAYLFVPTLVNVFREAVRPSDDEDQSLRTCRHLLLHPCGKLHAGALAAVLVEEHDVVSRLQASQDEFSFALLLLVLTDSLRVLELGYDLDVEGDVVPDALCILLYDGGEAFVGGLAYHDEYALHGSSSFSAGATYS